MEEGCFIMGSKRFIAGFLALLMAVTLLQANTPGIVYAEGADVMEAEISDGAATDEEAQATDEEAQAADEEAQAADGGATAGQDVSQVEEEPLEEAEIAEPENALAPSEGMMTPTQMEAAESFLNTGFPEADRPMLSINGEGTVSMDCPKPGDVLTVDYSGLGTDISAIRWYKTDSGGKEEIIDAVKPAGIISFSCGGSQFFYGNDQTSATTAHAKEHQEDGEGGACHWGEPHYFEEGASEILTITDDLVGYAIQAEVTPVNGEPVETEPTGRVAAAGTEPLCNLEFIASDIPDGTYDHTITKTGFTIKAEPGRIVTAERDPQTIDGGDYTTRLRMGGAGTKDYRSIRFTTGGAEAELKIICASAGGSDPSRLGIGVVAKGSGEAETWTEFTGKYRINHGEEENYTSGGIQIKGTAVVEAALAADTTYCLYTAEGGGTDFYAVYVTYASGTRANYYTCKFYPDEGAAPVIQRALWGECFLEPPVEKPDCTLRGWYAAQFDAYDKLSEDSRYNFGRKARRNVSLYAGWDKEESSDPYEMDMSELEGFSFDKVFTQKAFTFTSNKKMQASGSKISVADGDGAVHEYTKYLRLDAGGEIVSFKTQKADVLTIVVEKGTLGTPGEGRTLVIKNKEGKEYRIALSKSEAVMITLDEALAPGEWSVFSDKREICLYYIKVKALSAFAKEPGLSIARGSSDVETPDLLAPREGNVLTVDYALDSAGDAADASSITWYRTGGGEADTVIKTGTAAADMKSYTVTDADEGYRIKVKVTPGDSEGNTGFAKTAETGTVRGSACTISFDLQGRGSLASEKVRYGEKIEKPADPEATGYQFTGWYREAGCKTPWDFDKDRVEEDITLYAGWEKMIRISFDLQGRGSLAPETVHYGDKIKKPADPEATGYQFTGWYKDAGRKVLWDFDKDKAEEDITLYAGWKVKESSDCLEQLDFGTGDESIDYLASVTGKCIAFTSRFDKDALLLEYKKDGEEDWYPWTFDAATGNYSVAMEKGTKYALRVTEKLETGENGVSIAFPGYKNPNGALTSTFKITSLTDAQLAGQGSASRMSAAYKQSGAVFTANGTLKYIHNCSGYLGAEGTYKSGWFLALRVNVQKGRFRDGGYVSVSYLDKEGNRKKQFYEYSGADSTLKDGYVDLILDLNGGLRESEIRVASDAFTNIKTYRLKLENLKLEEGSPAGVVAEAAEKESYGVKTSAPIFKESASGSVEVLYDSVAYSAKVDLGNGETRSGNYIALKVEIPDSMKNTKAGCFAMKFFSSSSPGPGDTTGNAAGERVVYEGIPEGASYVLFLLDAKEIIGPRSQGASILVVWGVQKNGGYGEWPLEGTDSITQTINIRKTENCYFETIPAGALLPKSIAFNGLSTTMYAGQSQNIATVINRKYEEDLIRLSYSTSDSSVLSVNRVTGVIKALKAGTATVTVEAVDADGKTISRSAKITVKNPTAPGSIKITDVKDTSVTVNWGKNVTGQRFEVYAVPYDAVYDAKERKTAAQWKAYVEAELAQASGEETPDWINSDVTVKASEINAKISGLEADTPYLFYVRNAADTAADVSVYAGSLSRKTMTKKTVFASIKLTAQIQTTDAAGKPPTVTDLPEDTQSFTVGKDETLGTENLPNKISYRIFDREGEEIQDTSVFTSVSYKSSNANVVKVDKNGNLSLGGQAGTAKIYVTGKDAAGTVRTSEADAITIRVIRMPSKLKAKTTTLVIGESISLKELITYNGVKGALSEIDTEGIDFEAILEQIPEEYFVWDETGPVSGDTRITAAALIPNKKGVPASGGTVKAADFVLTKTEQSGEVSTSTAAATIKINDMSAPVIKSTMPADTSISFTFAFNTTVKELTGEHYYYTVTVKDMVTGGEAELRPRDGKTEVVRKTGAINKGMTLAVTPAPDMTVKSPVHTCVIKGLSSNKKYRISVTAHYDTAGVDGRKLENQKISGTKDVTTRNHLLASEDGIDITYISLTELKKHPDAMGSQIFKEEERDTDSYGHISLENNETYILMAQVSNLSRALEMDKLKWTISSGDKNAATIKAGSSTFEAQLKAMRTGTFTVTATSTVTKEELAVFTVTILPYQSSSGEGGAQTASAGPEVAYLGGILSDSFLEEKKKAV